MTIGFRRAPPTSFATTQFVCSRPLAAEMRLCCMSMGGTRTVNMAVPARIKPPRRSVFASRRDQRRHQTGRKEAGRQSADSKEGPQPLDVPVCKRKGVLGSARALLAPWTAARLGVAFRRLEGWAIGTAWASSCDKNPGMVHNTKVLSSIRPAAGDGRVIAWEQQQKRPRWP